MTAPAAPTYGDIDDLTRPLAVLVHGFPDTPYTWRHLGPRLAEHGYRVVAPWLPGYGAPHSGPVSVGTYVRRILEVRDAYGGDERAVLIGHDWGANAGYGAVNIDPSAFARLVTLAVPPTAVMGQGLFGYAQLRRSFYIWFIQQPGLPEMALLAEGFWESLWRDWSPGYDATADLAELRRHVTAETIAAVINPYRAPFNAQCGDTAAEEEAVAALNVPPIPTLYLHGHQDGAIGAELLDEAAASLPASGSAFEVLDGVGHFLHLEAPDAVAERIVGWLG